MSQSLFMRYTFSLHFVLIIPTNGCIAFTKLITLFKLSGKQKEKGKEELVIVFLLLIECRRFSYYYL